MGGAVSKDGREGEDGTYRRDKRVLFGEVFLLQRLHSKKESTPLPPQRPPISLSPSLSSLPCSFPAVRRTRRRRPLSSLFTSKERNGQRSSVSSAEKEKERKKRTTAARPRLQRTRRSMRKRCPPSLVLAPSSLPARRWRNPIPSRFPETSSAGVSAVASHSSLLACAGRGELVSEETAGEGEERTYKTCKPERGDRRGRDGSVYDLDGRRRWCLRVVSSLCLFCA